MRLRLRMTGPHKLACYTINGDGMDGCPVCFVAREVLAGGNATQLNGAVVCVVDVLTMKIVLSGVFSITIVGMCMRGLLVDLFCSLFLN
jgi:hypothetical protein